MGVWVAITFVVQGEKSRPTALEIKIANGTKKKI
jgi:hypothetical protein